QAPDPNGGHHLAVGEMVGDLARRPVAGGRSVELLLGHAVERFEDDSIAVAVLADQPRPFVRVHLSSHEAAHGAADRNRTRNLLFTKQLLCQLSYGGASKERTAAPVSGTRAADREAQRIGPSFRFVPDAMDHLSQTSVD